MAPINPGQVGVDGPDTAATVTTVFLGGPGPVGGWFTASAAFRQEPGIEDPSLVPRVHGPHEVSIELAPIPGPPTIVVSLQPVGRSGSAPAIGRPASTGYRRPRSPGCARWAQPSSGSSLV